MIRKFGCAWLTVCWLRSQCPLIGITRRSCQRHLYWDLGWLWSQSRRRCCGLRVRLCSGSCIARTGCRAVCRRALPRRLTDWQFGKSSQDLMQNRHVILQSLKAIGDFDITLRCLVHQATCHRFQANQSVLASSDGLSTALQGLLGLCSRPHDQKLPYPPVS